MINHGISPKDLAIIQAILRDYKEVYVFGSRIKGTYKKFSDLDICFKQPLTDSEVEQLNEQFCESDLPFKVDIVLYDKLSDAFKQIIDQEAFPFSKLS